VEKKRKKILPFPAPVPPMVNTTIICEIGDERFALHWHIEELEPRSLVVVKAARSGTRTGLRVERAATKRD
jgi:hypothetical protein